MISNICTIQDILCNANMSEYLIYIPHQKPYKKTHLDENKCHTAQINKARILQ